MAGALRMCSAGVYVHAQYKYCHSRLMIVEFFHSSWSLHFGEINTCTDLFSRDIVINTAKVSEEIICSSEIQNSHGNDVRKLRSNLVNVP